MNGKQHVSLHPPISAGTLPGRYSPPYRSADPMRRHCMTNPSVSVSWSMQAAENYGNLFGGLDDSLLSRAEALGVVDISKGPGPGIPMKHDTSMYHHGMGNTHSPTTSRSQVPHHGMEGVELLDPIASSSIPSLSSMGDPVSMNSHTHTHTQLHSQVYTHGMNMNTMTSHGFAPHNISMHDVDTDPRELEAFAERFKQRRIKLGVTQADVGKALGNLKLPGVGSLSQSTICRFESLTLSHNNMIALKPVLAAWLEEAEAHARNKRKSPDILPNGEKKRKRTSIAAPEKRSLEAYFAVQPRPSGEKIAAIAEKLDLKKNVVRVWFCNQRQKQKRMKFSAAPH